MTRKRVLIDTDPGVDDTLAIYMALGSPQLSVDAITTCAGNASIEYVTRNAAFICRRVQFPLDQIFPGSAGRGADFARVHGSEGLGEIIPSVPPVPVRAAAVGAIKRFLESHGEEERIIVAVGPLSNIAAALESCREAFERCSRLVILGGTFAAPGNKGPVAEFNFSCDPEAADYVLTNCPCRIEMIPLDICMRAVLPLDRFEEIRDVSLRKFLFRLCGVYSAANHQEEGIEGVILYDPLAIFCAAQPEAFRFERYSVRVDTGNSVARGYAVVDRRLSAPGEPPVSIAMDCDLRDLYRAFFEGLNRVSFSELPE